MNTPEFRHDQLESALEIALGAVWSVAPKLLENFGRADHEIKNGDEKNWLTRWDSWAEEIIKDQLNGFSHEVGILGEETGRSGNDASFWTVDPIDGTGPYVRGIDTCTTQLSLVSNHRPVMGVIHDFVRCITYSAIEGQGAYSLQDHTKTRLQVSQRALAGAHIETYVNLDAPTGQEINSQIRHHRALITRRLSAGYTFALIARGAQEGFIGFENPYGALWDYAPGAILVQEAGGKVVNVGSDTYSTADLNLVISNVACAEQLQSIAAAVAAKKQAMVHRQ